MHLKTAKSKTMCQKSNTLSLVFFAYKGLEEYLINNPGQCCPLFQVIFLHCYLSISRWWCKHLDYIIAKTIYSSICSLNWVQHQQLDLPQLSLFTFAISFQFEKKYVNQITNIKILISDLPYHDGLLIKSSIYLSFLRSTFFHMNHLHKNFTPVVHFKSECLWIELD